jgi:hypothetical protein
MAAWILVPCLVTLRGEFNAVAPARDEGADGAIGDSNHTSASDHTPDEDSDVLRGRDADRTNEVHALDIDSTGPWPDGRGGEAGGWFDRTIQAIAAREKAEYESATLVGRLQNIIWRGRIISRSWGWSEWRAYDGPSKHFDHAHFSARYLSSTESDTRPWGVAEEDDMTTKAEFLGWLKDADVRAALCTAVMSTDGVVKAPAGSANPDGTPNTHWAPASYLAQTYNAAISARGYAADARALAAKLQELDPAEVAAMIPPEMARQVADLLAARLQA